MSPCGCRIKNKLLSLTFKIPHNTPLIFLVYPLLFILHEPCGPGKLGSLLFLQMLPYNLRVFFFFPSTSMQSSSSCSKCFSWEQPNPYWIQAWWTIKQGTQSGNVTLIGPNSLCLEFSLRMKLYKY